MRKGGHQHVPPDENSRLGGGSSIASDAEGKEGNLHLDRTEWDPKLTSGTEIEKVGRRILKIHPL